MRSFRENPDGEANQRATRDNEREIFALRQQVQADKEAYLQRWKDASKQIISSDDEKYEAYHARLLQNTYESGRLEALQWASRQIIPDGNPEIAQGKIEAAIKAML